MSEGRSPDEFSVYDWIAIAGGRNTKAGKQVIALHESVAAKDALIVEMREKLEKVCAIFHSYGKTELVKSLTSLLARTEADFGSHLVISDDEYAHLLNEVVPEGKVVVGPDDFEGFVFNHFMRRLDDDARSRLARTLSERCSYGDELARLRAANKHLTEQYATLDGRRKDAIRELNLLQSDNADLRAEVEELRDALERTNCSFGKPPQTLVKIRRKIAALLATIHQARKDADQ